MKVLIKQKHGLALNLDSPSEVPNIFSELTSDLVRIASIEPSEETLERLENLNIPEVEERHIDVNHYGTTIIGHPEIKPRVFYIVQDFVYYRSEDGKIHKNGKGEVGLRYFLRDQNNEFKELTK